MNLTIPVGVCTTCGRKIKKGEQAEVVLRAGNAWKDGFAELKEGAEFYTATVLCPDCQAASDPEAAQAADSQEAGVE